MTTPDPEPLASAREALAFKMNPLTPEEKQVIRERLEKSTPGPWKSEQFGGLDARGVAHFCIDPDASACSAMGIMEGSEHSSVEIRPADADLIAHAPADLRRLLEEVERLEREVLRLATRNAMRDASTPEAVQAFKREYQCEPLNLKPDRERAPRVKKQSRPPEFTDGLA